MNIEVLLTGKNTSLNEEYLSARGIIGTIFSTVAT
jgi:hypothetical protein